MCSTKHIQLHVKSKPTFTIACTIILIVTMYAIPNRTLKVLKPIKRVPYTFFVKRDWDYFFLGKRDLGFFCPFVIRDCRYLIFRERERILGIIRDALTVSIFLRECIFQIGIGDPQ